MTARVDEIWRHPIKSHGAEALESTPLTAGTTLPWDRAWAVTHEASRATCGDWASCANFTRVAKAPALAAIHARLHEDSETVTLIHPDRPELTFSPDRDAASFLDWVAPLMPADRAAPTGIIRAQGRGMTDNSEPTVSLKSTTAHRMVEQKLGKPLSRLRWRGNVWIDGLAPGEEFEWAGRHLRVGSAVLRVLEPITRCTATMANPDTGARDADTLSALDALWGAQEFGMDALVVEDGQVSRGDAVTLIP